MEFTTIKSLLKEKSDYAVVGTLWIDCSGERFIGPGRVELMEKIDQTGSINQAAKLMGMSYKKAWEMINALNVQAKSPLVITQTGGEKGGGSQITAEAKKLIAYHLNLRKRFKAFLDEETNRLKSDSATAIE